MTTVKLSPGPFAAQEAVFKGIHEIREACAPKAQFSAGDRVCDRAGRTGTVSAVASRTAVLVLFDHASDVAFVSCKRLRRAL